MWVKRSASLSPRVDVKPQSTCRHPYGPLNKFWEPHVSPARGFRVHPLTSEPSRQNFQKFSLYAQHFLQMPCSIARAVRLPGLCTIPLPPGEWGPGGSGQGATHLEGPSRSLPRKRVLFPDGITVRRESDAGSFLEGKQLLRENIK